jgi:hypothetical protein
MCEKGEGKRVIEIVTKRETEKKKKKEKEGKGERRKGRK